jgi:hypothetical protein
MSEKGAASRATSAQRREWAAHYDAQVRAGARVNRSGGMRRIQDADGDWFQRNANSCNGSGWHSLADKPDMRKPPSINRQSASSGCFGLMSLGLVAVTALGLALGRRR